MNRFSPLATRTAAMLAACGLSATLIIGTVATPTSARAATIAAQTAPASAYLGVVA